ncbi:MAG: hypothetical protein AAFO03_23805 [Bacteroidota bacterium]
MSIQAISNDLLARLQAHKKKTEWVVFGKSAIFPTIFLLFTLIPSKYLGIFKFLSRRGRGAVLDDNSLMQDIGVFYVLLGIAALYLLFVLVMAITYRYFALRDDVENRTMRQLEVTVHDLKVLDDYGTKYYDLYFRPGIDGCVKVRFFDPHPYFNILRKGQPITLVVSEAAFYPFDIITGKLGN